MSNLSIVRDKVNRYTAKLFNNVTVDEDGDLKVRVGSTAIFVSLNEFSDSDSRKFADEYGLSKIHLNAWAPVLIGVKPSNEFFKWVATEGQEYIFGNFRAWKADEDDEYVLIFGIRIAADELDETELRSALWAVAETADASDDELMKRFGGKRFEDN